MKPECLQLNLSLPTFLLIGFSFTAIYVLAQVGKHLRSHSTAQTN